MIHSKIHLSLHKNFRLWKKSTDLSKLPMTEEILKKLGVNKATIRLEDILPWKSYQGLPDSKFVEKPKSPMKIEKLSYHKFLQIYCEVYSHEFNNNDIRINSRSFFNSWGSHSQSIIFLTQIEKPSALPLMIHHQQILSLLQVSRHYHNHSQPLENLISLHRMKQLPQILPYWRQQTTVIQ